MKFSIGKKNIMNDDNIKKFLLGVVGGAVGYFIYTSYVKTGHFAVCPNCTRRIDVDVKECPYCGTHISNFY